MARDPKILTLDTETIDLDGELKRIAIYDGERVIYGDTFNHVSWIIEQYYEAGYMPHVYIHNADFDLRKIPQIFEKGNVVWSRTKKIGTKFAKIVCRHYIIHDSFKLLPMALSKLSKDFGLEHGKLDLFAAVEAAEHGAYKNNVDFLNRCPKDHPLYLEYLGYDVISLYELLEKLSDVSGIEFENLVKCISTASMSKYVFKNGYKGKPFGDPEKTDYEILTACKAWGSKKKISHSIISYIECEYKIREGFYGGRTEVFKPILEPKENVFGDRSIAARHYDVNSLYPYVMHEFEYPYGFPTYENDARLIAINWDRWRRYHEGLGYIRAVVYVPKQHIPPLPAKMGKLAFVTGYIEGTWTYTELEYAVKNCGVKIVEFKEQIHFKKTYKIFKNFVEVFYEMKAEGKRTKNAALTTFAKLMLNTGYGYTCLRRDDKTAFRDISQREKWEERDEFIFANEEYGYIEIFDNVHADSIQVMVGAYVTSYARLVWLDAARRQSEHGEVYYGDTDSIVCSDPLPPSLVSETELGLWDCEGRLYRGLFIQPKVYYEETAEGETIKFKGISKARQKELTSDIYEDILYHLRAGDIDRYLVETGRKTLPSLSVAMKKNENPNIFKVIDKSINMKAKGKRNIDFINNTSEPWHMDTLQDFYNFSFEEFNNPPNGINIL